MTIQAYTNPDFGWVQKLVFLLVSLLGVILCVLIIVAGVRICVSAKGGKKSVRRWEFYERTHNRVQRFYEMIIAGTSVLSFSCSYVIINHIYTIAQEMGGDTGSSLLNRLLHIWAGGKDFVLLLLICLSCVLNTVLDKLIIPLKRIKPEEKACVRMLAMFYCILILVYLNIIGDESEYNPVMMYYLGLMVGRFVYFDASFKDFLTALWNMLRNLYQLVLAALVMTALCFFGFRQGYLLERNYYIVGVFYTHLFLLAAVFLLRHSHILDLLIRKPAENRPDEYGEADAGEDDAHYDDEGTDYYDDVDPAYDAGSGEYFSEYEDEE